MASREEMGKALYDVLGEATDGDAQLDFNWPAWEQPNGIPGPREPWMVAAEKFAAWLREQDEREMARDIASWKRATNLAMHEAVREAIQKGPVFWDWDLAAPCAEKTAFTCPKGHVLTHPEDIEKKYCGQCRSYLDPWLGDSPAQVLPLEQLFPNRKATVETVEVPGVGHMVVKPKRD